jgi:hypothetical protein
MLLIHSDESRQSALGPEEGQAMFEAYGAFTQSIVESGQFVAGDALQPSTTATTVRVQDGRTVTTDGPYAETKEALGGYYLVDCADLDAAIEVASRIPDAAGGAVEVRPVLEPADYPTGQ